MTSLLVCLEMAGLKEGSKMGVGKEVIRQDGL